MGPDAQAVFGQFLASFRIAHPVPADVGLERLAREVVCLPVHPFLSASDVERVAEATVRAAEGR